MSPDPAPLSGDERRILAYFENHNVRINHPSYAAMLIALGISSGHESQIASMMRGRRFITLDLSTGQLKVTRKGRELLESPSAQTPSPAIPTVITALATPGPTVPVSTTVTAAMCWPAVEAYLSRRIGRGMSGSRPDVVKSILAAIVQTPTLNGKTIAPSNLIQFLNEWKTQGRIGIRKSASTEGDITVSLPKLTVTIRPDPPEYKPHRRTNVPIDSVTPHEQAAVLTALLRLGGEAPSMRSLAREAAHELEIGPIAAGLRIRVLRDHGQVGYEDMKPGYRDSRPVRLREPGVRWLESHAPNRMRGYIVKQ